MKISHNWLKEYISPDFQLTTSEVATILTNTGLEVEGVERIQSVKGGLEGLIVGEVLTKTKHPDADRLNLTTVNVGQESPLNIVCGAPNVEKGQKVVVAPIGTKLYNETGEVFKIKKSKIRGQLSEGMLCAEDEIGLGDSHDGIMVLEESVEIGKPVKDYFEVEDDTIYEIGLTPNRSDAMGHIGVARDLVAAIQGSPELTLTKPIVEDVDVYEGEMDLEITVNDVEGCLRYSGICISDINVTESPDWLKRRLKSIGLEPINNVVDITNFVLHETGQPLHAFDRQKIKGDEVIVKRANEDEILLTLDKIERKLSDEDLVIANTDESLCLAGIMGGLDSGVSDSTKSIFLESAYFEPVTIRKSAKRHGLNTSSSFRFERGADPEITTYALKRAVELITNITGGKVSSGMVDFYPKPLPRAEVFFSFKNCTRLIGEEIPSSVIKEILNSLEIEIQEENKDGLSLLIPPYRSDVNREVDVVEEVLRIYGYNKVSIPRSLTSSLSYRHKPEKKRVLKEISSWFVANGFFELLSNSLTKSEYYNNEETMVQIKNPLSKDLNVLRKSMIYGGLEAITYNQNRKQVDLRLFELGKTYSRKDDQFVEYNKISLFISGRVAPENWNTQDEEVNFYYVKGVINALLERFGITTSILEGSETDIKCLSYGLTYSYKKDVLVEFGKVDDHLQNQFDIDKEVFYAELNMDGLLKLISLQHTLYKEVPKYPVVRRDLALLINKSITYDQITQVSATQVTKLLKRINLFDVYEGKKLGVGKKSYGVSFLFQDEEKTLTDKNVDKIMSKIISALESKLGVELR